MKQRKHQRNKHEALKALIQELKVAGAKNDAKIWKAVALELERPTRIHRSVNIFKLDQTAREGEIVIVPGKVLSMGEPTKKLQVAAYKFSEEAKKKLNASGKTMTIQELVKNNPKGQKVRIIG